MDFYAFYAARNDIEYSVRKYANNTVPSFAVVAEALAEHLAGAEPLNYGVIERAAFKAADALREHLHVSSSMTDAERAYGDMTEAYFASHAAAERMTELHALIAAEYGYEGDEGDL